MREHEVIAELVRRLGGATLVATHLGCEAQPVHKWRIQGRVPWKWRLMVRELAQDKGIELSDAEQNVLTLLPERKAS